MPASQFPPPHVQLGGLGRTQSDSTVFFELRESPFFVQWRTCYWVGLKTPDAPLSLAQIASNAVNEITVAVG